MFNNQKKHSSDSVGKTLENNKQNKNMKVNSHRNHIRWEKLDNTAHLFPVISGEDMSNVYRITIELNEKIQQDVLQKALNIVLPKFNGFNLRLRKGVFWYYFEENGKPAPKVKQETKAPCRYIVQNKNRSYLFRVTFFENRINMEVFHALADGAGTINFLKELTYQYLRLVHPELKDQVGDDLSAETSLNREDSFLQHYRKSNKNKYPSKRAYLVKGEKLKPRELGVMHGFMPVSQVKDACKRYGVSINEYLVAAFAWAIYKERRHGISEKRPIRIAVPVNLRPFFESVTTKNFFAMVSAEFTPQEQHGEYTFEEIVQLIRESLRAQINKEYLEQLFSYNVSNQMNLVARAVPLFLKNIAIRHVYNVAALANTTTVTNLGKISVNETYQPYIKMFGVLLPMSKGQNIKGVVCSYGDTLCYTFTSVLKDTFVQRNFFRKLAEDGIEIRIESNGVYYE